MTPYLIAAAVLLVPVFAVVSYGLLIWRLEDVVTPIERMGARLTVRKTR